MNDITLNTHQLLLVGSALILVAGAYGNRRFAREIGHFVLMGSIMGLVYFWGMSHVVTK